MAAGKKDEKADNKKDAAGGGEAGQKKKKLFMFIGLGLLLVLISVGATFFVVSKMLHKDGGDKAAAEEHSEEKAPATPAIYLALKPNFTVNFDVNGRQRFLQTELTLMYRDANLQKLIEDHMPEVRNGLVMLLSRQVFDELQTAEGKENLRAAALKVVQDIVSKETEAVKAKGDKEDKKSKEALPEGNVENILFTQFVMQ